MGADNVHIILNPTAGHGRAGKMIPAVMTELKRRFKNTSALHVTKCAGDATRIANALVYNGASVIVAAGGDGTIQETVNGLFCNGTLINEECALGVLNFGTGQGFAQSLHFPSTLEAQFDLITHPVTSRIDLGHVTYQDGNKNSCSAVFINECQVGIGAEVVSKLGNAYKFLGGTLAFGMTAFKQLFSYKSAGLTATFPDGHRLSGRCMGIVVGNGAFCGGNMQLTPQASHFDGLLDALWIDHMDMLQRLISFPKIYSGTHITSGRFTTKQCTAITIDSHERFKIEADGELLGWGPCKIKVLPQCLPVCSLKIKQNDSSSSS